MSALIGAGNGSQWSKMGEPLLRSCPVFRGAVHACAAALKPYGLDLLAEFCKEGGWKHPALAMTGLVAVQVLLSDNCRDFYYTIYVAPPLNFAAVLFAADLFALELMNDSNRLCDEEPHIK